MNFQDGFNVPIMAMLCDGSYFYYFKFEDRRQAGSAPSFSQGILPDGSWRQRIPQTNSDDPGDSLRQTRLLCDSLYYVFLSGYRSGLEAYWNRSLERSKSASRKSTPRWYNATVSAGKALEEAKSAWNLRQENKLEESNASAERAIQSLAARQLFPLLPLS
jgi:hypothetical protein